MSFNISLHSDDNIHFVKWIREENIYKAESTVTEHSKSTVTPSYLKKNCAIYKVFLISLSCFSTLRPHFFLIFKSYSATWPIAGAPYAVVKLNF